MQSLESVELFLFVLWPNMSVPDITNLGLASFLIPSYGVMIDMYCFD